MKKHTPQPMMLLDDEEAQLRQDHVNAWMADQQAARFGLDQHTATALNAYLDGTLGLAELLTELRRPYLH